MPGLPSSVDLTKDWACPDGIRQAQLLTARFQDLISGVNDPLRVVPYLTGLGLVVQTMDQLETGISDLEDEEELSVHRCEEGLVISHASDDLWLLVTNDLEFPVRK